MSDVLSTPRKVASRILYERLRREVLTVEALDAALVPVFGMLLERGVIGAPAAESVPCPRCGVDVGRPCRDTAGEELVDPHWQRARKWEHSLDTREERIDGVRRDVSRMFGLAGLAARGANR